MLSTGTTLSGRYKVQSLVGHGGMGAVYRARDERLGRDVAIKLLRADLAADVAARQRFLREGQIAAQIVHPNVVRTYDAGDDPAGPYLVQEFLVGRTLDQLIPLAPREAAATLRPIAAALGHIHSRGYVHCDVKPQNIFLRDNGTPALLDFGIARVEGSDTTALIATPHYLAPERVQGAPPTAAADLYALGIVLFQAVAGRPPFEGAAVPALLQQHIEQPVPPLAAADPSARVLDRIIARLTAKRPADRYPSTAELEHDLGTMERGVLHDQPTIPVAPVEATQPVVPIPARVPRGAPTPPPPQQLPPAQTLRRAWAAAPTWRKRRWIAAVLVPLVLLLLSIGLARAATSRGADIAPASLASPTALPAASPASAVAAPAEAENVAVPAVIGLPYAQAATLLTQQGLVAQPGEEWPATEPAGVVLETEPPATAAVAPGATVTLHLSAGPAPAALPPTIAPAPQEDDRDDDGEEDDRDDDRKEDKQDKDNGQGDNKKKD